MQLVKLFTPSSLIAKLAVVNRNEAFRQMADIITKDLNERNSDLKEDEVFNEIIMHEEISPTLARNGVAFPHVHVPGLETVGICIATLEKPVYFSNNMDAEIIVMTVLPQNRTEIGLKIMATISRFLKDDDNRAKMLAAQSPLELYMLFEQADLSVATPICAADVMRPPRWFVTPDAPLEEVTRVMYETNQRDLPVVDDNLHILGIITTNTLFTLGMPDFFTKLKSISFIAEFDPFEKYFEEEVKSLAKDVMEPAVTISPNYTILEIVFDLVVRHIPHLFVVDENKRWIGTVGHSTVLDNIIRY